MLLFKKCSVLIIASAIVTVALFLSSWTEKIGAAETGYVKARNRMMAKVYPENADNSKGPAIYSGWLQQDQTVKVTTERGRIILEYRYSEGDNWTTDVHMWCQKGNTVTIP